MAGRGLRSTRLGGTGAASPAAMLVPVLAIRTAVGDAALAAASLTLLTAIRQEVSQPGTGRIYQLYNPRRVHRASAPGEPPAVDLGALRNSAAYTRPDGGHRVGVAVDYAEALEYPPLNRPFMRPALAKATPTMRAAARVAADAAGLSVARGAATIRPGRRG